MDGSHTPSRKQGEYIVYKGRKAARTTNALFFSDKDGLPLSMGTQQAGNHNDLIEIQQLFTQMCALLEEAGIDLRGIFMNAGAGFDAQALREICAEKEIEVNIAPHPGNAEQEKEGYVHFDEELYKEKTVIERTNAWIVGFKALLVRYEVKINSWMALHFTAFALIFITKKLIC